MMPSTPSAKPNVTGRSARRQRGYITTYGLGRVCASAGCQTQLSQYNKSPLCHAHTEELGARKA